MDSDGVTRIIVIPGLGGSGPDHWQALWAGARPHARMVRQASWDDPQPDDWIAAIDATINAAPTPAVLVAHSLGCPAVAHWATRNPGNERVVGALLVAPCDVERPDACAAIARFGPVPPTALPFRSIVVASRDDPYVEFSRAHCFATRWGSAFVDAGALGHINAASGLGGWGFGQVLLEDLLAATRDDRHARLASLRGELSPPPPCFGL
ncbi:MAG: RBBP9/YdeN family alpha/beta hydrolase [Janthinobacterium lividum]